MCPLLPVQPPSTHTLPSSDIRQEGQRVGSLLGSNISVKAVGPPLPKTTQHHLTPHKVYHLWQNNNVRLDFKRVKGNWIASEYCFFTALCYHHMLVYNVSDWSIVLSPQMCCVQTWRFNLIAFSPTAPVMVLRRCQVCAKCSLSSRNTQRWPCSSTTKSALCFVFCKHFLHFHVWACLNLTNREIGVLLIFFFHTQRQNNSHLQIFCPNLIGT